MLDELSLIAKPQKRNVKPGFTTNIMFCTDPQKINAMDLEMKLALFSLSGLLL